MMDFMKLKTAVAEQFDRMSKHVLFSVQVDKHELAERDAADQAQERAQKRQRVLEILSGRDDETLKSMSTEDLRKLVSELG